jgi:magnesium-transporting ATPase (P-type)
MQRAARNAVITWPQKTGGIPDINNLLKVRYIATLPFDSDRKMMSVLVESQDPNEGSVLLVKGADSAVFKRLKSNSAWRDQTEDHVNEYAKTGLRHRVENQNTFLIGTFENI